MHIDRLVILDSKYSILFNFVSLKIIDSKHFPKSENGDVSLTSSIFSRGFVAFVSNPNYNKTFKVCLFSVTSNVSM